MTSNDTHDPHRTEDLPVDLFATDVSSAEQPVRTLGGYRLIRTLGRGGMGVVYEAERLSHVSSVDASSQAAKQSEEAQPGGPRVALKTLQSSSAASLARLKAEFRVVADLAHPNLVQLGELDTTDREPFFTMEIVRGLPFDEYVRASFENSLAGPAAPYHEQRLRDSLLQMAEGLNALHGVGLIHRDIKPSNVMVTDEGRVVILDMGLAIEVEPDSHRKRPSELAGTPYYMAPEQARGDTLTAACDWYAVGVILFESLTGERAFQSRRADSLLQEKLQVNRPVPRDILSTVPDALNQLCRDLLHPDPNSRPSGQEVIRRLQGTCSISTDAPVWIGREKELATLRTAWCESRAGAGRVVFVAGQSGLGKTSLVEHFLNQLRLDEPVVVFRGRCYDNESVAYRGFDGVIDSLAAYLRRLPKHEVERVLPLDIDPLCQLFPVLGEVPSIAQQRGRLIERRLDQPGEARERRQKGMAALRELLCRLARYTPFVIFVDDLQLGDDDTAAIFVELFKHKHAPESLFLATFRTEDASENQCLRQVRRCQLPHGQASLLAEQVELVITKLTESESVRLASSLLLRHSIEDPAAVKRIASEANGDPLFIRLLADYRIRRPADNVAHDRDSANATLKRWTLTTVIRDRLDSLDAHERIAMETLSAAGRPVGARDLESIAGMEGRSIALIRSLRIKRLVRRLADREHVEIFHDKIRETLMAMLVPKQIAGHCLALAKQMELTATADERDVDFLADLYRRGGERKLAGECYEAAAVKSEATYAFTRAIECYRFAIDLLQPTGNHAVRLHRGLGDSLANASRSVEAAEQYLKAAADADDGEAKRLMQLASLRYLTSGHVDQGIVALQKVLAQSFIAWPRNRFVAAAGFLRRVAYLRVRGFRMNPKISPTPLAMEKIDACWSAAAGLSLVDPLRGSYYIAETLSRSLGAGSAPTIVRDLAAYMGVVAIGGSRSRKATARVLRAVRTITSPRSDSYSQAMQQLTQGIAALLRGNWALSLRCCDRAIDYLADPTCHGKTWETNTARTFALWSLQYQGNFVEMSRRQPELLRWAKESDDLFATLNFGTQVMAHLQLAEDRPDESLRRLEEDKSRLSNRGFFIQHHNYVLAQTYSLMYQGDYEGALATIEGQWKRYRREFLSQIQQVRIDHRQVLIRALLAAAAHSPGRKDERLSQVRRLIRSLRGEKVAWATALADAFDAACHQINGHTKQSAVMLLTAKRSLAEAGMGSFALAATQHLQAHELLPDRVHDDDAKSKGENAEAAGTGGLTECWRSAGVVSGLRFANFLIPGFSSE